MSIHQLTENLLTDLMGTSLWAFRPELTVCATVIVLLLVRMVAPGWRDGGFWVMLVGTAAALGFALAPDELAKPVEIFTGMLVYDTFAIYMRGLLLAFALLFALFTRISRIPDRDSAGEFYVLVLGATLGMCLMVAANHMLIVFLGIEMASVPSYALAGFLKHRRQSGEAALKYAVFGAGTAGVMLYGISLLAGTLGSAHLPTMAVQLAETLHGVAEGTVPADRSMVLVLGGLMVMVGLAFKLSAVPFHFWAPDVFEGAAAEVAAFLSVASKAAALALLVRLALGFGHVEPLPQTAYLERAPAWKPVVVDDIELRDPATSQDWPGGAAENSTHGATDQAPGGSDEPTASNAQDLDQPLPPISPPIELYLPSGKTDSLLAVLAPARAYIAGLIALLAAVTCTFGNLAAYGQTNMKRLLAYSTIAHAGYMMMPVAAAVALLGSGSPAKAEAAVAAVAFYAGIYLFMNLGAFAAVAFLRNVLGSEQIADYAGLIRRSPGLAVCMAIILFSLLGLPPLAGFAAKFTIFAALVTGWESTKLAWLLLLLAIGLLNTVLSLFYYLRVVKTMIVVPEPEDRPAPEIGLWSAPGLYCLMVTLPILVLGVWWNGLFAWATMAASTVLL